MSAPGLARARRQGHGLGESEAGPKRDVAALIGMSVRTVDNLLRAGCPHIKISSRKIIFDLAETAAWIKQRFGQRRRGAMRQQRAAQ